MAAPAMAANEMRAAAASIQAASRKFTVTITRA